MAKVSTRKRKEVDNMFGPNPIEDAYSAHNPGGVEQDEPTEKKGPTIEELQTQIAEMNRRYDQMEKTNLALMTRPPEIQNVQQTQQQVKDADLPDPTMDPVGYANAVTARADKRLANFMDTQRTQSSEAQRQKSEADIIWDAFSTKYEDYAQDDEKLEFVSAKVLKDVQALGIDPKRYMTTARDKFFTEVTTKYDEVFGKPGEETKDDEPATRTAGVFSGMESGGKPVTQQRAEAGDMIKDLQEAQKKSGFY